MSSPDPKGEFRLIRDYFQQHPLQRDDVRIGIGDDGAVVRVAAGQELVLVMDTLVAGVHFPLQTSAYDIGWKALAVNLSDLAAMGAEPAWLTLALTLPEADEAWLTGFSRGLFALADRYRVQLIGGDTTRGPLSITVQAHGLLPAGQALTRGGARVGDRIYVSGRPGEAALGLQLLQAGQQAHPAYEPLLARLNRPQPRIQLGLGLRGLASSCIDISDGLLADLQHILDASGVGAELRLAQLPLSAEYRAAADPAQPYQAVLAGGDDYELLFTLPAGREAELQALQAESECLLTCIGEVVAADGLRCITDSGGEYLPPARGFDHFKEPR